MSAIPANPTTPPPAPSFTPELSFPENLPVSARRADIAAALNAHQVVIVCGETGSGKTTQLPKIVLTAGRGTHGKVGMTQPRRIAAKSVANRLAEETKTRLGGFIGWQVRFTDQVGPDTRIKVMTDGILLAETQSDPEFRAYDTLILDEAHERSLNIDFLLGYLKTLLPRRPELKVIISSATLEADRFSAYFNGAPVVEVSGRTYPVEMRYRPPAELGGKTVNGNKPESPFSKPAATEEEPDFDLALLHAVDELAAEGPGDILVFLPGEREIRDAQESLRKHHPPHTEILPLFARLSVSEQEEVFRSHSGRRIVLSTNVAETSLTVPGIRYVVDAGLARVKRYSIRNKIEQLKIEKVSQASANQRAGRCGRVAEGICIRLYDEQDFLSRPKYTTPELLRSSLAGVILRMKSLRLPEIESFPFLDAPEPKRIRDGQQLLIELGALDDNGNGSGQLTGIGKQLAHLPVDPRIGRMLIAARDKACLHEVLVIAAALTSQDPRERPLEHQAAADQKHARFNDPNSDFISLLKLWHYLDEQNAHRKSQRKLREGLKAEYLSPLRVREWRDVYGQLTTQVKELGWRVEDERHPTASEVQNETADEAFNAQLTSRYAVIHQALLPGLLGNLGFLTEDGVYLGAREVKFLIFPGSGVKKKPKWLMGAEIVETKRIYARTVAKIEPEWVEHAARHLLKLSYSDPHWAKKPAHVAASLRATLYGLPIVNGRKVHYGPIDPVLSRELFIRGALVNGDFETRAPWFVHNQRLLEEIDDLSHRSRNARIAVDEEAIYQFFDARIPMAMHNGAAFEKWRREAERNNPKLLFLERENLLSGDKANREASARDFPPSIEFNGVRFALTYRFDPGTPDDGVTLEAPLAALNQIPVLACEWLVPGLLEEKITALIKSLPQSIRRTFVPVPDYARAATQALLDGKKTGAINTALADTLAAFLGKTSGTLIPRDAWRPEALPAHLNMHFRVQDERGKTLAEGRDLGTLRQQLGAEARQELARSVANTTGQFERDNVTKWDFGDLPESMHVATRGKPNVAAFPALEHVAGQVRLALFDSAESAEAAHREGVARLIWLGYPDLLRQSERDLGNKLKAASLQYGLMFKGAPGFASPGESLVRDVLNATALDVLGIEKPAPRNQNDFENAVKAARPRLPEAVARMAQIAQDCIAAALKIEQTLAKAPVNANPAWKAAVLDLRGQLAELVFPGFMARHPANRLIHLPRYLKAMELRLNKLANQAARDLGAMNEMAKLLAAWRQRRERLAAQGRVGGNIEPEMEDFRWRLEELRVSLFAQELKTPEPVSVKRLEKRWAEIAGL
ncbi:MAG: ATP-dependent RNA helicase HrpA [Hydrogenophilales bacterium 28-61-23]|nr:MAG: ATP-dependent RNA helicase HrpA [Hydrogenophilales bacterium 28-61-23]